MSTLSCVSKLPRVLVIGLKIGIIFLSSIPFYSVCTPMIASFVAILCSSIRPPFLDSLVTHLLVGQ
jgi:hypothetical protein